MYAQITSDVDFAADGLFQQPAKLLSPLLLPYVAVYLELEPDLEPVTEYPVRELPRLHVGPYRGEEHFFGPVPYELLEEPFGELVIGPVADHELDLVPGGYEVHVLHEKG